MIYLIGHIIKYNLFVKQNDYNYILFLNCSYFFVSLTILSVNILLVYYRRYLFYLGSLSSRGNLGNQYVSSVSCPSFRIFLHGISLLLEGSTFECSALLLSWNCILHIDICFGNQMCSLRIVLPGSFLYLIQGS